jgi:uncharacterized protein YsxB (DUF464 family)
MLKIKIFKDKQGYIKRYTVEGHANYDAYGKDIVCAAISVLTQTALFSLVEVCGVEEDKIDYFIDDITGYLDVNLPVDIDFSLLDKTEIVLKSLEVGIKSVIESYPKYVTLEYGEV